MTYDDEIERLVRRFRANFGDGQGTSRILLVLEIVRIAKRFRCTVEDVASDLKNFRVPLGKLRHIAKVWRLMQLDSGFTRIYAQTGAVTLIQRFGSALNLNVHFHMLFLDGVYTTTPWGKSRFHRTNAPDQQALVELVHAISHRVAGLLEREGILERDEDDCMDAGGRAKQEPEPRTVI